MRLRAALLLAAMAGLGFDLARWPDSETTGYSYTSASPSLAAFPCHPTLGCNDADGILIIDRNLCSPMTSGDARDANATYGDAQSDWINGSSNRNLEFETVGVTAAGALSMVISDPGVVGDRHFCRCNGVSGDWGACANDGECSGAGTCDANTSTGITHQIRHLTCEITDFYGAGQHAYEQIAYRSYSGCDAAGNPTFTLQYAPRRAIPAGARCSLAWYDGLHHGAIHGPYEGACVLEMSEEQSVYPVQNMQLNGYLEQGCTTGWRIGKDDPTDTDAVVLQLDYDPSHPNRDHVVATASAEDNGASGFRGASCRFLTGSGTGTDRQWVESHPAIAVEPGRYYSVSTIIRVGGFLTPAADGFAVSVIDDATGSPVTERWWSCRGTCIEISDQNIGVPGIQFDREWAYGWMPMVGEFVAPASGLVRVRFSALAAGIFDTFGYDEVVVKPSVDNADGLRPILGTWTPTTLRLGYGGDSSADECKTSGFENTNDPPTDPASPRGGDDVPCGMDIAHGRDGIRSDLTFKQSIYRDSTIGHGGRSLRRFVNGGTEGTVIMANGPDVEPTKLSSFIAKAQDPCLLGDGAGAPCNDDRFDAVILEFAFNELTSVDPYSGRDLSPEELVADRISACRTLMSAGIRCILFTETSFAGNGTGGSGSTRYTGCTTDGVTNDNRNCGDAVNEYNRILVRGSDDGTVRGAGW